MSLRRFAPRNPDGRRVQPYIRNLPQRAKLQNLAAALSRITKTSRICVHTEDAYVVAHITKLSEMAETAWKDSKGGLIRNADLWKNIWELAEKHRLEITANTDKHSYSGGSGTDGGGKMPKRHGETN